MKSVEIEQADVGRAHTPAFRWLLYATELRKVAKMLDESSEHIEAYALPEFAGKNEAYYLAGVAQQLRRRAQAADETARMEGETR